MINLDEEMKEELLNTLRKSRNALTLLESMALYNENGANHEVVSLMLRTVNVEDVRETLLSIRDMYELIDCE